MLQRRVLLAGLGALPAVAAAQPRKKIVVGFVSWWPAFMEKDYVPRLRKGLAALGYVEPQTLELLPTFVGGDPALARETAKRLVARGVDVIVVSATPAATIVKEETQASQTPVVLAPVSDPLATGLAQSIARPGGNLTGMSMAGPDLSGKRLQILRDIMPNLQALGFVGWTRDQNNKTFAASLERVTTQAGLKLVVRMVDSPAQIDDALMAEFKEHVRMSRLRIDEDSWQKDIEFIKAMIRYEIDVDLFGVEASRRNLSMKDPQLQFALTLFPEAQQLLQSSQSAPQRRAAR